MFTETVTSADGTQAHGLIDEPRFRRYLLVTAVSRGYQVVPFWNGGARITRQVARPDGMYQHVVTIEPASPLATITAVRRQDLDAIARRPAARPARLIPATGQIKAGLWTIPPGAASKLIDGGLAAVTGDVVTVSVAVRLGEISAAHPAETTPVPVGYLSDESARHSTATCGCGWTATAPTRPAAIALTCEHRAEKTRPLLDRLLEGDPP